MTPSTVVSTPVVLGCPRCRLLQSDQKRCGHCGEVLVDVRELATDVMTGVAMIKRPARTGWRDGVAAFGSGFGVLAGTTAVVAVTGSPLGMLAFPAFIAFFYSKQFWRTGAKTTRAIQPIEELQPPIREPIFGIARKHEATVEAPGAGTPVLAASICLRTHDGLFARAVRAAPFWLVIDDRKRVLVEGAVWVAAREPKRYGRDRVLRVLGVTKLAVPPGTRVDELVIEDGDRVALIGDVREELMQGALRDETAQIARGEPGSVVWVIKA